MKKIVKKLNKLMENIGSGKYTAREIAAITETAVKRMRKIKTNNKVIYLDNSVT